MKGSADEILFQVTEHKAPISDLQASADRTMVITASKDNLAKVGGALSRVCFKCTLWL